MNRLHQIKLIIVTALMFALLPLSAQAGRTGPDLVMRVAVAAELASKYADPVFPKYRDIMGVIEVESTFNPKARNGHSLGLMMIDAPSHRGKFRRAQDLYDPDLNVRLGVEYLKELYEKFGSREAAIMAYNVGPGNYLRGMRPKVYLAKVRKATRRH